ncbi:MAG: recombination regulator RecX [Lachnospiraceae bacterium]|nr:recombination regulator RecX [Lachnospiraceae bacterium]
MLVTGIEEYNKKQVKLYLDGEFAFLLYKGELSQYHIKEGEELAEQTYRLLTEDVLVKRVRLRAMNLLTKRAYTEQGLRRKLREGGYPPFLEDNALAYVKSFGYINDESYARDYIASLSGRYTTGVIAAKLKQKGISDDIISICMEEAQEELREGNEELLYELIRKKCRDGCPEEPRERAKLMRFLASKGFAIGEIRRALNNLT